MFTMSVTEAETKRQTPLLPKWHQIPVGGKRWKELRGAGEVLLQRFEQ